MADKKPPISANISDVADYAPSLEEKKAQYRKELMEKHTVNRGGRFQPFAIEHMPFERTRLANPMTAEDRMLRKQWLKDQELHPSEPILLEERWPRNIFRRMYMAPWNAVEKLLTPSLGERWAVRVRVVTPRMLMGVAAVYWTYYYVKYNSNDWEKHGGWAWCTTKPMQYPDEPGFDPKKYDYTEPSQFYDKGFSQRAALLDLKTSRSDYN